MAKKKKNNKKSPVKTESLPTFSYGFIDEKYYMLIDGNRMKFLLNKRQVPTNQPIYNFLTNPSFGEESTIHMSVGESLEGSWIGGYIDEPGTTELQMLDYFFETSDDKVATIQEGESSGEYVISAEGPGTAILKVTEIDPGNIRRSASIIVVVTIPVLSFDANGGTGTMDPIEADSEGKVTLPTECSFGRPQGKSWNYKWIINDDPESVSAGTEITLNENSVAKPDWQIDK